jgi:hypothetical protein
MCHVYLIGASTTIKLPPPWGMLGSRPVMNWTAHATGHWLGFCGVPSRARRSSDNRARYVTSGRYPDREPTPLDLV